MSPEAQRELHKIADELEGLHPVPSTFASVRKDALAGARITLRMVVELIRERADGKPDTSKPARPEHLSEMLEG